MQYRVNAPEVIAETVGEETMVVNLGTGHYFNLQGTAVDVWEGIERAEPLDVIVQGLEARFEAAAGEIESAVSELVRELQEAALIVAATADDGPAPDAAAARSAEGVRGPFVKPQLAKFTDMQDIILLDPVHEVDPRGWPHAAAGA
jgi:hypothetical protein